MCFDICHVREEISVLKETNFDGIWTFQIFDQDHINIGFFGGDG